jgi:hypothetical protein
VPERSRAAGGGGGGGGEDGCADGVGGGGGGGDAAAGRCVSCRCGCCGCCASCRLGCCCCCCCCCCPSCRLCCCCCPSCCLCCGCCWPPCRLCCCCWSCRCRRRASSSGGVAAWASTMEACAALSDLGRARSLAAWAAARPARPDNTVLAISKCQSFFILFPIEMWGWVGTRTTSGRKQTRQGHGWFINFYCLGVAPLRPILHSGGLLTLLRPPA